jgi:ribose 1,5-bisphosphokinase PhnN
MHATIKRYLHRHVFITFFLMGCAFFLFGIFSLNLIYLLKSNIELFLQYGAMVIADGALRQLAELIGYGYLSLAFYVLFKACERILVERLVNGRTTGQLGNT